jgi:hypothetical protein
MTHKRSDSSPDYAVSDGATAYIADAPMVLALQFEANHLVQIRRHYQSITPGPGDGVPGQLDLFGQQPPA